MDAALIPTPPAHPDAQAQFFATLETLVMDSVSSLHTKRAYAKALRDFFEWMLRDPSRHFTKATVQRFRTELEIKELAPSTVNLRISAIRKLALEAADNGLMPPEIAAAIARVKGTHRRGVRLGNWLTLAQADTLLKSANGSTLKGKRDKALLAVLIGTGLRREEAARLTFDQIQEREGRLVICDLLGKHGRVRTIPVPSWAQDAIKDWAQAAQLSSGCVFRAVDKAARVVGSGITAQTIFETVRTYAGAANIRLAPHDLRRTHAKLAFQGHAPLEQIQLSLGHASIATTERYLGVRQDLKDAPCDHLGLESAGEW